MRTRLTNDLPRRDRARSPRQNGSIKEGRFTNREPRLRHEARRAASQESRDMHLRAADLQGDTACGSSRRSEDAAPRARVVDRGSTKCIRAILDQVKVPVGTADPSGGEGSREPSPVAGPAARGEDDYRLLRVEADVDAVGVADRPQDVETRGVRSASRAASSRGCCSDRAPDGRAIPGPMHGGAVRTSRGFARHRGASSLPACGEVGAGDRPPLTAFWRHLKRRIFRDPQPRTRLKGKPGERKGQKRAFR
jgi:hypothetical protein